MSINWGAFALKSLQLALIADQEYAAVSASPAGAATTLLGPNNFQNLTLELAQVFTPAPAPAIQPPAPVNSTTPAPPAANIAQTAAPSGL